jgi:hypothetical protein
VRCTTVLVVTGVNVGVTTLELLVVAAKSVLAAYVCEGPAPTVAPFTVEGAVAVNENKLLLVPFAKVASGALGHEITIGPTVPTNEHPVPVIEAWSPALNVYPAGNVVTLCTLVAVLRPLLLLATCNVKFSVAPSCTGDEPVTTMVNPSTRSSRLPVTAKQLLPPPEQLVPVSVVGFDSI